MAKSAAARKKPVQTPEQDPQSQRDAAALLREMDDALHYERIMDFWHKYRGAIIGVLVALFIAVAAFEWYKSHREQQMDQVANEFFSVTNKEIPTSELIERMNILVEESPSAGFDVLARLVQAEVMQRTGNLERSISALDQIIQNTSAPTTMRDLARLYKAMALVDLKPDESESILVLLDNENSAFELSALEVLGYIAENKGNFVRAFDLYERLLSQAALPNGLRQRVTLRYNDLQKRVNEGAN